MKKSEKIRLMSKYRVKDCSQGEFGKGFVEGLFAAETHKGRPKVAKKDVFPPT